MSSGCTRNIISVAGGNDGAQWDRLNNFSFLRIALYDLSKNYQFKAIAHKIERS